MDLKNKCEELTASVKKLAAEKEIKLVSRDLDLSLEKQGNTYLLEDDITIRVENNNGVYLWIEDRKGEAFAWIINVELCSMTRALHLTDAFEKDGEINEVSSLRHEHDFDEYEKEIKEVISNLKDTEDYLKVVDDSQLYYTLSTDQDGYKQYDNLDTVFNVVKKRNNRSIQKKKG